MYTARSIFSNGVALFGIRLFMPLSFFMVSVLIARLLGVHAFGVYATVFSWYVLFRILSNFGLDFFLLREVPRRPESSAVFLNHAFVLASLFSLVNVLLMNGVLWIAGYSEETRWCGFLASLALFPESLNRNVEACFTGLHKTWPVFFTVFARESAKIAAAIVFMRVWHELAPVIAAVAVGNFTGLLANAVLVRREFGRGEFSADRELFARMFGVSAWLAFIGGVNSLFLSMDVIVLSKVRGEAAVGHYNAAGKFLTVAFLFIDSAGTALFPVLSGLHRDSPERFRRLAETAMRWLMAGFIFFIAVSWCFADVWVTLVFGPEFLPSAGLLRILAWIVLFLGNSYFMGRMFFIANAQKYDFISISAACAVNAVLCWAGAVRWGAAGTAAGALASTAFLFVCHAALFRAKVFPIRVWNVWGLPLAGGILFAAVFAGLSPWNRPAAFGAAACVYAAYLFFSGTVPRSFRCLAAELAP